MKLLKDSVNISCKLLKIMLPVSILVKILSHFGIIETISRGISPVMGIMGLSGEMGIVWATAMTTNIYAGILTLFTLTENTSVTVAEITILSTIILVAHSLPVELKVISETGAKPSKILGIRVFCAIIAGVFLNIVFKLFNLYQENANFSFIPEKAKPGIFYWIQGEAKKYMMIFFIIFILLAVMEILQKIGVIDWINLKFSPMMKLFGIESGLSFTCIVGLTMGISYGSGFIIKESREGKYSKRSFFLVAVFMSLCHGLIEDTLLMVSIGAKMIGIFWFRLIFAIVVTVIFNKLMPYEKLEKIGKGIEE
ncbi:nucleoside recognition domain-containing protein [Ilyobacter polytropus]|uniref:Nucleoside recognition domain protein n=1 Tax=Ilyobacter polytropus (strain ATCC 51220 / DSM 2926 / LMG 16218 / CuHBu1) TaxID=572544 RepID=E3HAH7_ILYPC|nr:nucleoside recognition domain-containing protein [Ilyobacter polytropus]ADO82051.1 nucleoside recognition domain protein [Ilyobacter polytropus DSM 2926]